MRAAGDQLHVVRTGSSTPTGVVMLLHGGVERSDKTVKDGRLGWHLMKRLQSLLSGSAESAGLAVWAVRNSVAGWNDDDMPPPALDAQEALQLSRRQHGLLPVLLVGHSMGGRTAVRVASDDSVVAVVGLAPWLPQSEPASPLAGNMFFIARAGLEHHRACRPSATADFIERARQVAAHVEVRDMGADTHLMLRGARWSGYVMEKMPLLAAAQ